MPIRFSEQDDVIEMDSAKRSPKGGSALKSTTSSIKNETSSKKGIRISREGGAGEVVAILDNNRWILVDSEDKSQQKGGIYWEGKLLTGSWPAPKNFCEKLEAKKFDGSPISGFIHFHQGGADYGTFEFNENGEFESIVRIKKPQEIINNEKNEERPFKQYFLELAKESNVEEWKNTEDIEKICNIIRGDKNFKKTLNGYLDQNLALNGLGRKAFVKQFDKILSLHDGQESQAACLLYMQLVNTGKSLDKVVTFKKKSNNRWISDDGYFLSVDGNNVISANFSLLCRMAKSNFVMLGDPDKKQTIGVCNFYDGDTQLGVIAFDQGGVHVSDFTGGYNESGGQVEFYDSIKEWFGERLHMKIRNCKGDISSLVRDPDIEGIIRGANLDPNSGKYSDYADAIWDRAAQRDEEMEEQPTTQGKFNLGNSRGSAGSNNAEKTPSKIDFTINLQGYYDVMETAITWSRDDGYDLSIDGSNTFTANQLIAGANSKKLHLRKIKPNAAKNENPETEKFDGGIDCEIVLGTGWGICDVGTVKFNGNGESIGLDGKVTMTVYEDYLKNVEKGEIVAFFANPKWVFVDTSNREVIGEILQGEKAFSGAWPTPEVFCKKLVAKKFNGDAVEGQIKFYTDNGLYVGDIKFSENGQGVQPITPENVKLNEETLNVIKFRKAFLHESSKSKNSEWNTLTSVSAICGKILEEPDFTTRLKNHLVLNNKFLNEDGLSYLKDTMKIVLPEEYEGEAACLVYLNFLNNNKSDTNENDDPNTVSFKRAFGNAWRTVDNQYIIRIKGKDRDVAASDYVIYKMIQDKLIKVYKINDQGALINPGAGSHKFEFVETGKAKCGLTIEINDEGEVTKSTCTSDNDDAGYKAFYDKAKLVLGEEEFKKQIIDSSGSMGSIASVNKIAEILKNKGLNPESRKYGDFANAIEKYIEDEEKKTLEDAKNKALEDLYTRLGKQQLPKGMTIENFDATDFAKKLLGSKFITLSKVEKKLDKLNGDKGKQIELLTRLLMRMERKKDFEKKHKFGKIRYALGEREKTDPKIKKCFEAAGKYIVKNYDKIDEGNLDRKCANLRIIFSDLYNKEKPWTIKLCGGLNDERTIKKCWDSCNGQGPSKAIMGIIFASMAGIEKSEDLICACDALKKGGIKNSDQKTFLGQASQIRKSIKALCGRKSTTYAARKAVIKKLLVNDYKFIDGSYCNELFPPEPKTSK